MHVIPPMATCTPKPSMSWAPRPSALLTISLWMSDTIPLMSAKDTEQSPIEVDAFRIWVGSDSIRWTSIWRIWTGNTTSDVYIAPSRLGGVQKLSLHGSGVCQVSLTQEYWEKLVAEGKEEGPRRATPRWRRPETPKDGATLAVLLRFPTDFLKTSKPVESAKKKKKRFFIEPADPGQSVDIGIFYSLQSAGDAKTALSEWGKALFHADLPSGERLWICGRKAHFDPTWIPVDSFFSRGSGKIYADEEALPVGGTLSDLSMVLFSDPKDGEPIVVAELTAFSLTRNPMG